MRKLIAFMMVLIMCLIPITSYAEIKAAKEPADMNKTPAELNGCTEEEWARLMDNRLEYEEIGKLVHFFNPSMSMAWNQLDDSVRDTKSSVNLLSDAKQKTKDNRKNVADMMKTIQPESPYYKELQTTLASLDLAISGLDTAISTYNATGKKLQRKSKNTMQLYILDDTLTNAVQSLMIAYDTVMANKKMLEHLVTLYEESYEANRELSLTGMATELDALKAQSDLISAKANLSKLNVTEQQLYNQLITLCGWKAGDKVEIGSIPLPNESRISSMNPDTDAEKAANSNSTIKQLHSAGHSKTSEGLKRYFDKESELMGYVRANMTTLYANVLAAQTGYEAAKAGFEAAKLNKSAVDTQFKQGQISKAQYLGASIEYVQKEAALRSAVDSYEQAVLTYEAALRGTVDAK